MTNTLIVDIVNNSYYQYKLTFSSENLDSAYTQYFNLENIDWMDDSSFVISGGSQNSILEGKFYLKNGDYKVLAKLFIWDITLNGHTTKTYVSVMKTTPESINNLRVCF
jgi:hypothetical protein